jgi:hypothetical protein
VTGLRVLTFFQFSFLLAEYGFDACTSDELDIQAGDVLRDTVYFEDWAAVTLGNERGLVPKNYCTSVSGFVSEFQHGFQWNSINLLFFLGISTGLWECVASI